MAYQAIVEEIKDLSEESQNEVLVYIQFLKYKKKNDSAQKKKMDGEQKYVSIVSFWEIAIKQSIKKIEIQSTIDEIAEHCKESKISVLNISPQYLFG